MTSAAGYWIVFVRTFADYEIGREYWVPKPLADVYVAQQYAYRCEPQPTRNISRRDVR